MSKFDSKKVMPRYLALTVILSLVGVAVVIKASVIMTAKKSYWEIVAKQQKRDSIPLPPKRGNILSSDGQLMASSIPEFKIYFDFQPINKADTALVNRMDTLWHEKLDSLCMGLHEIFPERSAEEFKKHLEEGRNKVVEERVKKTVNGKTTLEKTGRTSIGHRNWPIWPHRINYSTYCQVKELPFINAGRYRSGFHCDTFKIRLRPFGSLAQRTVGDMYVAKDSARYGLELTFDSILRGTTGLKHPQKVLNKTIDQIVAPAIDGADIVTTIDVGMQDLAERALLNEMKDTLTRADTGVAILMEVATGDVKAIVNMERTPSGRYEERMNNAVSYVCEPGSVFKVASIMVALDDGVCDTTEIIHSGCGIMPFGNRLMKDHNWRRGGYGDINVAQSIAYSSNVGVSHIINKYYGSNPTRYVNGLYRIGIAEDLNIPIKGYHHPNIRMPDTKTTNRALYWSSTTLPWMSIGYETQIAPINTVAFYNAIANGGKMMRPRFVKAVQKDGECIKEFPPEVIKQQIASPQTIKKVQDMLRDVVTYGTGRKPMQRMLFPVAGKTGTAQIADEHGGYHSGITRYWLSFAGYFPADNPRYSCIVCMRKKGLPASGTMSAKVFRQIAEGVIAQDLKTRIEDSRDSASILIPDVKNGNIAAADYVLSQLHIKTNGNWAGYYGKNNKQEGFAPVWGKAIREADNVTLSKLSTDHRVMPDVTGMGARDAVFLLEDMGVKVHLSGRGRVKSQSIPSGMVLKAGMTCELHLQ